MAAPIPPDEQDPAADAQLEAEVEAMRRAFVPAVSFRRAAALVGIVLFVACFTGFVCGVAQLWPAAATALLVLVGLFDLVSRRRFGGLPHGTWFLLHASLLFWTAVGWSMSLDRAIVVSHEHCGTGMMMGLVVLPPIAATFAGGLAILLLYAARRLPELPGDLARIAVVTCGILAVVFAPFVIARTLQQPSSRDAYLARLPIVEELPPASEGELRCNVDTRPSPYAEAYGPRQICAVDTPLGGCADERVLRRVCDDERCSAVLIVDSHDLDPIVADEASVVFHREDPLELRADDEHDIYYVSSPRGNVVALSAPTGRPIDVSLREVASSFAPPASVLFASLASVAMILCGAVAVALRTRRGRRLLEAAEGTVDDAGWLTIDGAEGDAPTRVDDVRPGRVVVLDVRQGEAYRRSGVARVVATTHDEVRAGMRTLRDDVFSVLAIVLPAALVPVVIAILVGLVF